MSLANVSDLVEDSLQSLDAATNDDEAFRAVADPLYDLEQRYSERPTYFRLMDLLTDRGYFLTVPVESHPDYETYREELERRTASSVEPVLADPASPWDEEDNPVVGYRREGELYVERGGRLWDRLVESGELTGEEAEPVDEMPLYEAAARVVEAADEAGDEDLVLRWYASIGFHLAMETGDDEEAFLERVRDDAALKEIRDRVRRIDDLELTLAHPEFDVDLPPAPVRDAHPVLEWWYELL